MRAHAFALPFTFFRQQPAEVLAELAEAGFTGVNLAFNYHASRDFLLRQGAQLEYLNDGFHYYSPDLSNYPKNSLLPGPSDHLADNSMVESVIAAATSREMSVDAWAVFAHNSALGKSEPSANVTNALGNNFLSELCPANPRFRNYALGLVTDLCSRGVNSIAMESLHWHGARHGEHHERFFMELSSTSEFLLSLCFCQPCITNFSQNGGDALALQTKVVAALQPVLTESDPWLDNTVSKDFLAEILGIQVLDYLSAREQNLANLYNEIFQTASEHGVGINYVDQSTLLDLDSKTPLDLSWLIGIDPDLISKSVSAFQPLVYRKTAGDSAAIIDHYKKKLTCEVFAILRPTFPDNNDAKSLSAKVAAMKESGVGAIDFYLLDTWRPRDLQWVAAALKH